MQDPDSDALVRGGAGGKRISIYYFAVLLPSLLLAVVFGGTLPGSFVLPEC